MEAIEISVGDHYFKQLEDKAILAWDCLKPLAGFSLCVVSLGHHFQPLTQLRLQKMALEGGPTHHS